MRHQHARRRDVDNGDAAVNALRTAADTLADVFTYTVRDTAGATSTATLTITVQGANDAPVAVDDAGAASKDGDGVPIDAVGNVLANDTDVDTGDARTVSAIAGGAVGAPLVGEHGTLTLNADGSYRYVTDESDPAVLALGPTDSLTETFAYQSGLIAPGSRGKLLHMMPTPLIGYGLAGHLVFAACAILLLTRNFNVFTAATATFLILPYAFHYDMTVANLGFAVLIFRHWEEMGLLEKVAACLGFLVPEFTTLGSWFAPPLLLAGLYVQTRRLDGQPLLNWPGRKALAGG